MSGKAWSLLAVTGQRQYAGNEGYTDDPAHLYRYDSNVGNSRHVALGDLAVVRDTSGLVGMALVSEVRSTEGTKQLVRCPVCNTTAIKKRAARTPAYRCNNGHEFASPNVETVNVQQYEAVYGDTWVPLADAMSASALRAVTIGAGRQNSIQEIDLAKFAGRIAEARPETRALLAGLLQTIVPEAGDVADDGYVPSFEDRRMTILRAIRARRGQSKFRNGLIDHHGARCMISGCALMEIVEAAHIWPYRGEEDNALSNGLLLRSDLHTLFDLDLLGIEPVSLVIHVALPLHGTPYSDFGGTSLGCGSSKPSAEALSLRWHAFQKRPGVP